jgi:hypothetical protein
MNPHLRKIIGVIFGASVYMNVKSWRLTAILEK